MERACRDGPHEYNPRCPASASELERTVIERVHVIGSGRVGSAISARLRERGVSVGEADPDVVLVCVPDTAIADVARSLPSRRAWIGHVSGATPLAALEPHKRRFSLHPLQTFDRSGDPSQFDGAWAAVTGETEEALGIARELAEILGLQPFELADGDRTLYHAGAVFASNYLVTLERAAVRLGVPAEALVPLMRRTIENGFDLTGPIARSRRTSRRSARRSPSSRTSTRRWRERR
jgi:hypothetical protein